MLNTIFFGGGENLPDITKVFNFYPCDICPYIIMAKLVSLPSLVLWSKHQWCGISEGIATQKILDRLRQKSMHLGIATEGLSQHDPINCGPMSFLGLGTESYCNTKSSGPIATKMVQFFSSCNFFSCAKKVSDHNRIMFVMGPTSQKNMG